MKRAVFEWVAGMLPIILSVGVHLSAVWYIFNLFITLLIASTSFFIYPPQPPPPPPSFPQKIKINNQATRPSGMDKWSAHELGSVRVNILNQRGAHLNLIVDIYWLWMYSAPWVAPPLPAPPAPSAPPAPPAFSFYSSAAAPRNCVQIRTRHYPKPS